MGRISGLHFGWYFKYCMYKPAPQAVDPPLPFFGSPSSSLHITVQTLLIVLLFSFSLFFRRSLIAWTSWLRNLPRLIPSNLPAFLLLLPACPPSSITCLPSFFFYLLAPLLLLPACLPSSITCLSPALLLLPACLPSSITYLPACLPFFYSLYSPTYTGCSSVSFLLFY